MNGCGRCQVARWRWRSKDADTFYRPALGAVDAAANPRGFLAGTYGAPTRGPLAHQTDAFERRTRDFSKLRGRLLAGLSGPLPAHRAGRGGAVDLRIFRRPPAP